MASLQGIGAVVALGERRYVVCGHRIAPVADGAGMGYLLVPYPLGFVEAASIVGVAAETVDAVVAPGYASEAGVAHLAGFAGLGGAAAADAAPMPAGAVREPRGGLLPVGSVVVLQGSDAPVMVLGFEPQLDGDTADYLGIPFPQGLVADDAALAFDAAAVTEVLHRGHWDDEGEAALAAVRRYRAATDGLARQFEELVARLTTDDILAYRAAHLAGGADDEPEPDPFAGMEDEPEPDFFDSLDEEPEPDFPDEGVLA